MRVPWHDHRWTGHICVDPLGNASCTLLSNIGTRRDDAYEVANAGLPIEQLDSGRLPCLTERAAFMSPFGYSVVKEHPYHFNRAFKDHVLPTAVTVPGYAFESLPFRWLSSAPLRNEIGLDRVPGFSDPLEEAALAASAFDNGWLMHGTNQRAAIDAFYEPIAPGDSLVFIYLKHSPLQEERTDKLLVGAARVADVRKPPMWNQKGVPPFPSSMWETIVSHSLRPDMFDGILLPYQDLIPLLDEGRDVSAALAWAPTGRDLEFSYVTEHVSDDAAIEALAAIDRAARALPALGLSVPAAALEWVEQQSARLWHLRGPVPGLASALGYLRVQRPYVAARAFVAATPAGRDPWTVVDAGMGDPVQLPPGAKAGITATVRQTWKALPNLERRALQILSSFDISVEQISFLMESAELVGLELAEIIDNPYLISVCTYDEDLHVAFGMVDRALFPPAAVTWHSPATVLAELAEHDDSRRVEAMLVETLESAALEGDTLLPMTECVLLANQLPGNRLPQVTLSMLRGLSLDPKSRTDDEYWSPLLGVPLDGGEFGYKLQRLEEASAVIRTEVSELRGRKPLGSLPNARAVIDAVLDDEGDASPVPHADPIEEIARSEKAAGLEVLFGSALTVLVGSAGTGKTTLMRALVDRLPEEEVLLLAPTGKARVRLQSMVGRPARTIASFLAKLDRFDDQARYRIVGERKRVKAGLVIIDEASMMTEQMLAATLDAFSSVRRLVLVGDPQQLPPIGSGRPFVDLVNELRPDVFEGPVHVGNSFVELQVTRRQGTDADGRPDLDLASWFGTGSLSASAELIWNRLRTQPDLGRLRHVRCDGRPLPDVLAEVLAEVLGLSGDHAAHVRQFALTYGGIEQGQWINWAVGSGTHAEDWQILTPTRSRGFGTVEINRTIKRRFRAEGLSRALQGWGRRVPRPLGPEQIVLGDKVMQTVNKGLKADGPGLDYVANGEIGVVVGQPGKSPNLPLKVEFSSQPGARYTYWPSATDDPTLELAWAITVHKAQGSEFRTTILVLPAKVASSRELLYTALTRQQQRVIVVQDGDLDDLRDLSHPWRSDTARRLTNLFGPPIVVQHEIGGVTRRLDGRVAHVTGNGTIVRSKNEVIVAAILDELAPGQWEYERPLPGSDGREMHPDFTVTRRDGSIVYWEHLGMLDNTRYARDWQLKSKWYATNGILPADQGGGPNGTLMATDDTHGVDVPAWRALAEQVIGTSTASTRPKAKPRRPRNVAP